MGYFSFKTADTGETIWNVHSAQSRGSTRTVFLLQPDGQPPLREESYNGFGDFGGVDAFVWLGRNNLPSETVAGMSDDALRVAGHGMFFGHAGSPEMTKPLKLSFDERAVYEDLAPSSMCESQGYDDGTDDLEPNVAPVVDGIHAITFGSHSSVYAMGDGIEMIGIVTMPNGDGEVMAVTVPGAVLDAAGLSAGDVVALVDENVRFIRFVSAGSTGATTQGGANGSEQIPAIVATRIVDVRDLSYDIPSRDHRRIVAQALLAGTRTLSDDQALLVAAVLGSRTDLTIIRANAAAASFA